MTYKTLLVHVDSAKRCAMRVDIAIRLAQEFDAHLVGLHVLQQVILPAYVATEVGPTVIEIQKRAIAADAARAQAAFTRAVSAAGLAKTEWRTAAADATAVVLLHARYADLVILGQSDPSGESGVDPAFPGRLVLAAGRPCLIVPYAGKFNAIGNHVLIAWNASREATRAVTDAIPLLRLAKNISVVVFDPASGPHGANPGADIGLYLARHGLRVEVKTKPVPDNDIGNEILSRAADMDSDLIVMGGYGHSRLQELVMGGATRTLLESMTVPVLMSH